MANPIKRVVKRVKTVAREVRDIPTAIGTSLVTQQDYKGGNPKDKAALTRNANQASKNLDKQIAEAARAILTGKSGTSSAKSKEYGKYKPGKMR
jgi:hypothetical protein